MVGAGQKNGQFRVCGEEGRSKQTRGHTRSFGTTGGRAGLNGYYATSSSERHPSAEVHPSQSDQEAPEGDGQEAAIKPRGFSARTRLLRNAPRARARTYDPNRIESNRTTRWGKRWTPRGPRAGRAWKKVGRFGSCFLRVRTTFLERRVDTIEHVGRRVDPPSLRLTYHLYVALRAINPPCCLVPFRLCPFSSSTVTEPNGTALTATEPNGTALTATEPNGTERATEHEGRDGSHGLTGSTNHNRY